ncbi:hypothetical protein WJT74_04900 [Sphingomicrobium sp. XHP0239]|uniref:ABC transporter substrate-binding protein n=1 Tax=Sphingomicrobium maritimum TaxID=3133972 RepID=UPI0031CCC6A2
MPVSIFASSTAAALRIASLDLCADEFALSFAAPGRVVSVSHLGADPAEFALARRARGLHRNDGTIADIARLKPDVILTSRALPTGGARLARRLGIRIETLRPTTHPREVRAEVRRLAPLLGNRRAAAQWIARFDRMAADPPPPRRALFLGAGGSEVGSLSSAWLAMAGIAPIAIAPGRSRIEQIVRTRPRLILESRYRSGDWHRGGDWRSHPLVANLDAPRYVIDGRAMNCGQVAMLGAIEELKEQRR